MTIESGAVILAADFLKTLTASGHLDMAAATTLTIASGAVTMTQNYHLIDTEAAAASDELDTITVAADVTGGYILIVAPASGARTVVLKHNTGNILCPYNGDVNLESAGDYALLVYSTAQSKWCVAAPEVLLGNGVALSWKNNAGAETPVLTLNTSNMVAILGGGSDTRILNNAQDTVLLNVTDGGLVGIGDTSNAKMTKGLTINQGAADDEAFALKSSDVATGMTDDVETDTFFAIRKYDGATGGAQVEGYGESAIGMTVWGMVVTEDTAAPSVLSNAGVRMFGRSKSGTAHAPMGTTANVVAFGRSPSAVTHVFIGNGNSYEDGTGWTAYDSLDDVKVLETINALMLAATDPIRAEFWDWAAENREMLGKLGLISFNEDGHHFINRSKMQELLVGAVRQLGKRLEDTHSRLDRLERLLLSGPAAA